MASLVNSLSSHFFLIFLQLTITYQASKGFCGKATVLQYYLFIIFNLTSKMALAWFGSIEGNLLLCFSALWLLTLKGVCISKICSMFQAQETLKKLCEFSFVQRDWSVFGSTQNLGQFLASKKPGFLPIVASTLTSSVS